MTEFRSTVVPSDFAPPPVRRHAAEPSMLDVDRQALLDPQAYPGDPSAEGGVEHIQTHLSELFLSGDRVYKFRKPVSLGFVDFTTREARTEDCLREVELNRRLSREVYLGVAPLLRPPGGEPIVGPVSEQASGDEEHCVVMRRLPEGRDALSLLLAGKLDRERLDHTAQIMARFHATACLGAPAPFDAEAWRQRCVGPALDNFGPLRQDPATGDTARDVEERTGAVALRLASVFEERRVAGRAVDGHGDLHLQHVWFPEGEDLPLVIDCLEFSDALRRVDAASEVAFLSMDLRYRGQDRLAERFLSAYAAATDDYGLFDVVDFFESYRACVRAKVASLASEDSQLGQAQRCGARRSAQRHLQLARACLDERSAAPVILVAGAVGTGKSTVASAIADAIGAIVVSSDVVRKRRRGLRLSQRAPASSYAPEAREAVYAEMLARAEPVVRSGRAVVLDATFSRRCWRERARAWARSMGAPVFLVEATCAAEVAHARLTRRRAEGGAASDAGPELQAASLRDYESAGEWPDGSHARLGTDDPHWRDRLKALIGRWGLCDDRPRVGA